MSKKIGLAAKPEAEVVLHDPDHEAGDRVYRLVAPTRTVKRKLSDIQDDLEAIRKELVQLDEDGKDAPDDVTDRITRLLCDELNLVLAGGDDAPSAGDLLYDGYMADRVTDDQISGLHTSLAGVVADPT